MRLHGALLLLALAAACTPVDELDVEARSAALFAPGPVAIAVDPDGAGIDLPASEALADGAQAFVVVFGYQDSGLFSLPRDSHTWATFFQVDGDALSGFTISWLPQDGTIGLGQGVEPGRNYGLAETLAIAAADGLEVRRSRVIEIHPALFEAARQRKAILDAGSATGYAQYRMIDSVLGRKRILAGQPGFSNCIHGVSDALVYANGAVLDTGTKFGFSASNAVYQHMSGYFLEASGAHEELAADLGL